MDIAGLVSSIITFVDFSWTIVRGTYDVYSSTSGATEENVHIGNVLQDLRDVTKKMRTELTCRDDHEKALLELEYQCRGLSSDLAAILQKLTAKRRCGLQSLNIMLRSLINEKEVRGIEKRLGEYREQMILRLNLILLERSVAVQNSLHLSHEVEGTQLRQLKQKAVALTGNSSVLRQLYFDDMYKRADSIADATYGTFHWLFKDENASSGTKGPMETRTSNDVDTTIPEQTYEERVRDRRQKNAAKISEFLEHDGGVFFLRGKPGSGKSTVMKYLIAGRGKQEADRRLRKWAGQKRLVRVSTMFLLHGTPLQRSMEGFYRTLFFELLCHCPDLADILFPKPFTRDFPDDSYRCSFRLETLKEAWERLLSIECHETVRICIFIDGMDELEGDCGDRFKFARILNEWTESEDIKIICSGRPNAEFNIVFDEPSRTIDLQDLTREDIRKILMKRFEGIRQFSDVTGENIQELVETISDQSEGVILWAVLVAKNLEDDIIHGMSLRAMKRTIERLPSGIEDLFNGMWQGLRQDAHHQLILRSICELLMLYPETIARDAIKLSWLEDALFDDEFPYKEPIQVLSTNELNTRVSKVRGLLAQYTKHFVEITKWTTEQDDPYLSHDCCFIHRSAQEFIQSKLDSVGSAPAPGDEIFHLDLRLSLILQMSVPVPSPAKHFEQIFSRAFRCKWLPDRQIEVHQIHFEMMEKLCELMEARRELLSGNSTTDGSVDECWLQFMLNSFDRVKPCVRRKAYSLFHLAVNGHQIDYITRILNDGTQKLDREDICLGSLICVGAAAPSYEMFELLVDHGADPDSLVEVYRSQSKDIPELIPLWLLFCFRLAFRVSELRADTDFNCFIVDLDNEFLILERFLCLGYGVNVKFLAAPPDRHSEVDETDLFGVDLAQLVRLAKPKNMSRLLLLLEPGPGTFLSLLKSLANWVLQPQFPLKTLPRGAGTIPFRRLSDECLSQQGWKACAAFEGEHQIERGDHYYIPGDVSPTYVSRSCGYDFFRDCVWSKG